MVKTCSALSTPINRWEMNKYGNYLQAKIGFHFHTVFEFFVGQDQVFRSKIFETKAKNCICSPHKRRGWAPTQKENFEIKLTFLAGFVNHNLWPHSQNENVWIIEQSIAVRKSHISLVMIHRNWVEKNSFLKNFGVCQYLSMIFRRGSFWKILDSPVVPIAPMICA